MVRIQSYRKSSCSSIAALALAAVLAVASTGAAIAGPRAGPAFSGRVVAVFDGDSLQVLNAEQKPIAVRVGNIDAPEKGQAFGAVSKQSLSELCFGKSAHVLPMTTDRYGRTIAAVTCNGSDVAGHQIKAGMAWAYRQYLTRTELLAVEEAARMNRVGLWRDAHPTAPWEWRRENKAGE